LPCSQNGDYRNFCPLISIPSRIQPGAVFGLIVTLRLSGKLCRIGRDTAATVSPPVWNRTLVRDLVGEKAQRWWRSH